AAPAPTAAESAPADQRPADEQGEGARGADETAGVAPETAAPEVAAPQGPVTFERIRAAWPAVLTRLESISRTSW
ncbi:DNA polymerase III subunit gamma and tau, partial [Microbacterium sp. H6]